MTRLEQYQKLPQAVQDFLFDANAEQDAIAALTELGMESEAAFDLIMLAEDVVLGTLKLTELDVKVGEALKSQPPLASPSKGGEITRELITQRLLPLDKYVAGVDEELKRLGGDPTMQDVERVEKEELSPEQFVKDSLEEAKLHLSDVSLQNRLEFLLGSYVRGVRSSVQTIAALQRPIKVGGLELEEAQSKQLLELLDKRRPAFEVEVGAVGEMGSGRESGISISPSVQQIPDTKPDPITPVSDLTKRLQSITQSRLKDIRDAAQTKALLAEPVITGGLGLSGEQLEMTAKSIEEQHAAFKAEHDKKVLDDQARILKEKRDREAAVAAKPVKDADELAKRFTALTGKAPTTVVPVTPRLSAASLPPTTVGVGKPSVVDVKYAPKLVGPIEELIRMTASDFRRLSSDPKEAAMKVRDKIDLLGNESYEKKVAGIAAWKSSPINQLYVSLSQEALKTGNPAQAVSDEWKAQGKEGLSVEEVKAIVGLNVTLRF